MDSSSCCDGSSINSVPHLGSGKHYKDQVGESYYLTTAINYTNGAPHMGHAYEIVTSDILVRIAKLFGLDARFQTGSDEHGQKIANIAEEKKITPKELCDANVEQFKSMNDRLNIKADRFIRTTDSDHFLSSQDMWKKCELNGDIYLGNYTGWYNVREENFVTELEAKLSDYKDPVSGVPLKKMEEPSYFFRISKYIRLIRDYILDHPEFVQPESSREGILSKLEPLVDHSEDLSISRTTFSWGIPVPNDPDHVMYVWFDALTNYLTGLNWNGEDKSLYNKYWKNSIHIVGKDITWFHCVVWPAMLMSIGVSLPRTVFSHGFVTASDGKKMSKSLGNVVDPIEQLSEVGSDTFRYYLAREGRFGSDVKYQFSSLIDYNNGELADSFGNLVSRITNLANKYCNGVVPYPSKEVKFESLPVDMEANFQSYFDSWRLFKIEECAQIPLNMSRSINKFLTEQAPWDSTNGKTQEERVETIRIVLEGVYCVSLLLSPFTTVSCDEVFRRLGTPLKTIPNISTNYDNLKPNTTICVGDPLFKRITTRQTKTFDELRAEKKERENKRISSSKKKQKEQEKQKA
ncbi:hypothetical protein RS030_142140 [Cryptosporidium xiaoi]|uniref:methionine--tRNA ligase n=1 Tax=Cryptosporidium xiaoi TaxID=659607 RepID=A0AAV9Y113_9CRYT